MKKLFLISLALLILGLAATASAHDRHHGHRHRNNWSHPAYHHSSWHRTSHSAVTLTWYQHRNHYAPARYRMERIHDHRWHDRFPGLRPYRWHDARGEGFWYRGHRVTDAVFFYNDSDELVSVGFMHNGAFVFIREDRSGYENRDSFFLSFWSRR
jgi:hypothetical protein